MSDHIYFNDPADWSPEDWDDPSDKHNDPQPRRVWFWKPELYWHGWGTLVPVFLGMVEYARHTVVFGWTISGRVIVALWRCSDPEVLADMEYGITEEDTDGSPATR